MMKNEAVLKTGCMNWE